ncbi:alpha/beta fold hydrolase [Leptobacterium flavescens]|uniref:Alpha/beta fold hydrolase n=1 Tax=Leptobacterium flavescens TaxID=472055 RepID=A0A6P0UPG4_9FLAO|nr:alpha/beta fold hydrolase [Leptobacterium flavescens]NER13729.1 alpha/beta fold hydrolase [Leptobacterium flavescens]
MKKITALVGLFLLLCIGVNAQETIKFKSGDGLGITADLYPKDGADTFIILFHQAGWSRGEYKEIAPKLNAKGYACLAVDLRSGGEVNGVLNQTHKNAALTGKATGYTDAFQDIEATVSYVRKQLKAKKIIIWGSSYSSSLVLKYGGDYPNKIEGILSFSPGEYFGNKLSVKKSASTITAPVFITSAKSESKNWKAIYDAIPSASKKSFVPQTKGNHGSRALWGKFGDHTAYWTAVDAFLAGL